MIRLILSVPEALDFSQLSEEQQIAINEVFGQFVSPMPGTVPFNGQKIVDAVTSSDFELSRIAELGLPFNVLYAKTWDGVNFNQSLAIDESTFVNYLTNPELGFHIPHTWAGWPQ